MNNDALTKPEHMSEQDWLQHLQWLAHTGRQAGEGYAEHLARVRLDADHSKALLQAQYRSLHAATHSHTDLSHPGKD